ncbi:hypothetical protein L7F22_057771 [Adiantum nelumboides]|nr:hypothetical protein [Adiantum nelumboides]
MAEAFEVAAWLKSLLGAPEFRSTEVEFADPIAYISKIEAEARTQKSIDYIWIPPYVDFLEELIVYAWLKKKGKLRPSASSAMDSSIPAPPPPSAFASGRYGPLPWQGHFDEERDILIQKSGDKFHLYLAGSEGPVVFCLHGGGYSGLSFALAAGLMKQKVQVVAMDLRGHGHSETSNDIGLSIETLCSDVFDVIDELYGNSAPALIFVGHSMGGAVAVHCAAKKRLRTLAAIVVLDVVEGTALASLAFMQTYLANRPLHFPSVDKAIEWSVRGGSLRNVDSARISVGSTLKYNEERQCYTWLTRLEDTEAHWQGWYKGLSDLFLSSLVPKILVLAGTERLDRSLTIGQMQGKFQMVVLRNTGHAIQEDVPDELAKIVLGFIDRNCITASGVKIPSLLRAAQSHGQN